MHKTKLRSEMMFFQLTLPNGRVEHYQGMGETGEDT